MARYRITMQDDGRHLPEVRPYWWAPWHWEPIVAAGYTVERCDYGGEKTDEAALANCYAHYNRGRHVPRTRYFNLGDVSY